MIKQLTVHLTIDEIRAIRRAFTAQIGAITQEMSDLPSPSVREIVEDELETIKKTDLYLSEALEAEKKRL